MKWPWSYWEQDIFRKEYDLLIVGAGFSGLVTAYFVKKAHPNWKIVLVETSYFQRAASTRNAGFACISSLSELMEDVNKWGWDEVLQLIEWRWKGLQIIRNEFSEPSIDWKSVPSGEFFLADGRFQAASYIDRIDEANQRIGDITGGQYYFLQKHGPIPLQNNTPFVEHAQEGQLHPVKLMEGWRKRCQESGVQIFENCTYLQHSELRDDLLEVQTDQMVFTSRKVLFCTNGQSIPLDEHVKQTSNLVLVSKPLTNGLPDFNAHAEAGYIYTRNIRDRLLIGGGRHILDNEDLFPLTDDNRAKVRQYLLSISHEYLHLTPSDWEIEYEWEGIIGSGSLKMPIMQAMDNNVFVLGRLSGMGVALSAYLGQEMAKIIDRT